MAWIFWRSFAGDLSRQGAFNRSKMTFAGLKSVENAHDDSVWAAAWVAETDARPALLLTGSLTRRDRADVAARRSGARTNQHPPPSTASLGFSMWIPTPPSPLSRLLLRRSGNCSSTPRWWQCFSQALGHLHLAADCDPSNPLP
ncbi:hypothetical protein SAY86_009225 [Trapa natans]|uniref:Uncharacterized protein n=1 Tax=Trapa natans TaxID=22666 RepID=A0AAN7QSU7_TRANT|nr:hypothetical protein SAY86_009225 [Trapa natans]